MSKKKKIVIIIAIALVVVLLATGLTVYFVVFNPKKKGDQLRAEVNTEKPTYENVLTKNRDDFTSEKEYALYLYESACAAFQNCEKCSYVDDYVTTTIIEAFKMRIPCQGCRFTVKTGTEYYYADYSGADSEGLDWLFGVMGKEEDTLFAIRSYADLAQMDYLYTEKVLRPEVSIDDRKRLCPRKRRHPSGGTAPYCDACFRSDGHSGRDRDDPGLLGPGAFHPSVRHDVRQIHVQMGAEQPRGRNTGTESRQAPGPA